MKSEFAKALKHTRKSRGLTQEDFSSVSSRTYLSALERGKKSPTLDKMNAIAQTLGINIVTLITLTYLHLESDQKKDLETFLLEIKSEVESLNPSHKLVMQSASNHTSNKL